MPDDLSFLETIAPDDAAKGFEKPETTGVKLLTIVRSDDDILDPNNENFIEGAQAGGFVVKMNKLVIPVPVRVIPIEFIQLYAEYKPNMGEFIRYVPLEEGRKLAIDPYKFGAKETKEGNVLQEAFNFIVMLPDHDNLLCMLSFQSSRMPDGEAWFNTIGKTTYQGDKIAPWNQVYSVDTKRTGNSKGRWYLIKPTFHSFVTLEEHTVVKELRENYETFSTPMLEDNTGREDY